jgi:hypothetical protein
MKFSFVGSVGLALIKAMNIHVGRKNGDFSAERIKI